MNICPLKEDFKFNGPCVIASCKYYCNTKNRCMGLDTIFAATERGVTQSEIAILKLSGLSKKEVARRIKIAQGRIKAAIHINGILDCGPSPAMDGLDMLELAHKFMSLKASGFEKIYSVLRTRFAAAVGLSVDNVGVLATHIIPNAHLAFGISEKEYTAFLTQVTKFTGSSTDG